MTKKLILTAALVLATATAPAIANDVLIDQFGFGNNACLLYTSPSPRDS